MRRDHSNSCRWALLVVVCAGSVLGQDRVSQTVHNLSAGGPGQVRATSENRVCIFCHAPHNTNGVTPLWNRELSTANYSIYQSSTFDAQPGQPTGSSKLCLSCHDGTIALGNVLSRADVIRMTGGDFIPAGLTNLGTDLSDDHPVSFFYTSGLAAADLQLVDPASLQSTVKLDSAGRLQCTSCHDPHHNTNGDFLVMTNEFGALCTTCHLRNGWSSGSHSTSGASVSGATAVSWPYPTVAQNACSSCHRPHGAGGHERLLIFANEEDNCLSCHSGQVAGANILAELDKVSAHDVRMTQGIHDPAEPHVANQPHVECTDCHNPHAVSNQPPVTTYIPIGATLQQMRGVTISGTDILEAQNEYEVCFRCHSDSAVTITNRIIRQSTTSNLRLKFSPTNSSFHPIVSPSPSPDTVSLMPGIVRGSLVRCTDCHNNDAGPGAGGSGPQGPHGSNNEYLLERNYTVLDNIAESQFEYDLCYKCHRRNSILADESFKEHDKHIRGENAPCSACHDPHGITNTQTVGSDHTHLINFDLNIVRPEPSTGRLEFRDLGQFRGSCTLVCHGENHRDERYGGGGGGGHGG
jgi:predicted CXXCH cytochrome family protein